MIYGCAEAIYRKRELHGVTSRFASPFPAPLTYGMTGDIVSNGKQPDAFSGCITNQHKLPGDLGAGAIPGDNGLGILDNQIQIAGVAGLEACGRSQIDPVCAISVRIREKDR